MCLAIEAVKEGRASAAVSAGNTGALMALAKFVLKTLPGIERPAIASLMPTRRSETVFLDLGANAECDAANLVQFAVMGEVFARAVLGVAKPTVGLLNIGTEEVKGHDTIREAAAAAARERPADRVSRLRRGHRPDQRQGRRGGHRRLHRQRRAQGRRGHGRRSTRQFLREAFRSSLLAKLGYLLAKPALQLVRQRLDPRRYNGAMFLG